MLSLLFGLLYLGGLVTVAVATPSCHNDGYPANHFKATFGSSPQPMTVDVDPCFIADTRAKVSSTRFPIDIDEPPFSEGIPNSNLTHIRNYWLKEYDWTNVQRELNTNFSHFTTTVGPLDSKYNYTLPIPLHFVHHRSKRSDAIPLLFIHGWPGSFLEVGNILEPLTTPPHDAPAFHVVAPSLPGFAFSPAPTAPGLGLIEVAAAFHELMQQLGYDRFVVQGGDFGSHTSRYMGAMFPQSTVSILSNLWAVAPNATDLQRQAKNETTTEENSYIKSYEQTEPLTQSFWGIEYVVPLQIGILLGDSPIGNLAWPYFGMLALAPGYQWGLKELIDWAMMLYIPGPYGSVRMYKELKRASHFHKHTLLELIRI